ncbi:MAG: hypothetical protein OEW27_06880 [Aquincola sp.]|nr:hypothetical protein [Aquincola sp.]MDH5329655.1 hypothetical protein [Aquincola sp.]
MPTRDHHNPSVKDCAIAARSPFSLLSDAYGRAGLHLHHRHIHAGSVSSVSTDREPDDAQSGERSQAFRRRWPTARQLRLCGLAVSARATFASFALAIALVASIVASLHS